METVVPGSADGSVFVWNVEKSAVVAKLADMAQAVNACQWSPQGTPLVSCDKAGVVTFWRGTESPLPPRSTGYQL
jgi:autophagy-related protein 16-1